METGLRTSAGPLPGSDAEAPARGPPRACRSLLGAFTVHMLRAPGPAGGLWVFPEGRSSAAAVSSESRCRREERSCPSLLPSVLPWGRDLFQPFRGKLLFLVFRVEEISFGWKRSLSGLSGKKIFRIFRGSGLSVLSGEEDLPALPDGSGRGGAAARSAEEDLLALPGEGVLPDLPGEAVLPGLPGLPGRQRAPWKGISDQG